MEVGGHSVYHTRPEETFSIFVCVFLIFLMLILRPGLKCSVINTTDVSHTKIMNGPFLKTLRMFLSLIKCNKLLDCFQK